MQLSFQELEWTYLVIQLLILAIAASPRLWQFERAAELPEAAK